MSLGGAITRRQAASLLLGLTATGVWAQTPSAAVPGWGILGELAGAAFHARYSGGGLTEESVRFFDWELPGRVLSMTAISPATARSPARRQLVFYRMEPDGRILGTWESRPIQVLIEPNGSAVSTYEINGRAYRNEIARTGPNGFRSTIEAGGGIGIREHLRITREEALRLAARFYPAEYRLRGSGGSPSAAPEPAPSVTPAASGGVGRRHALVVGVSAYENLRKLDNPVRDARAVARSLASDFDVDLLLDPDRDALRGAVEQLSRKAAAA